MTEELKIVVKATTDDAKKKLKGVKEELNKIDKESKEAGKSTKEALAGIGKGATVAIGAIVGLTAALVGLGKGTEEFRKAQAKVNTTFQSLGSNTQQAAKTYKDLYRFLGDDATAAETAQSLALITTNEKELAEWSTILQGVYGSMGDKLPINSLAEAANETLKVGKVTSSFADALNWAGISEDAFNEKLAQTTTLQEREALMRNTLNSIYGDSAAIYEANNSAMLANNESQYRLNTAMAEAAKYTTPLMTALNNLGATLFSSFGGALQKVCAYLVVFIQWIAKAIAWVGSFFSMFSKSDSVSAIGEALSQGSSSTKGLNNGINNVTDSLGGATKAAKELKKQTMGFDELNVVSSNKSAGGGASAGGGGVGSGIDLSGLDTSGIDLGLDGALDGFEEELEKAREKLEAVLVLIGLAAAGFLAWKISNVDDWAKVGKHAKTIGGWVMVAAGAMLLLDGYTDAWANGIDWGNLIEIITGIGLIVGGLALTVGGIAAPIALIAGGIAMVVLAIKDLVTNGYSMEAVITLTIGVLGVLIGVIWAFNAALLANPITWVVAAIVALVAIFVILWNECDAFREFWINLWDGAKKVFSAVWDWIKEFFTVTIPAIFNAVINFVKENWQGLLLLLVNPFAGAFKLLYDNCDGFREFIDKWVAKIGQFFKDLWQGIKNTFSSVGKWFSDVFTSAGNGIKKAFSSIGSFFSGIWQDIKDIFSKVGSTIGSAISGAVSKAVNGVLSNAVKIINGFISAINLAISLINEIPGVNIKKLNKLEVPKLATGGILTRESLFIGGEMGKKEAVLPLEQNTEWMDILADRIAGRNNAPSKIVLAVDGKELGWASINNINGITRQTGNLQLILG